MKKLILMMLFFLMASLFSFAQDYSKDTVWTKITDQSKGFYLLKFSPDDAVIVGHGYEKVMFYDALTGDEIARIDGNNEVHYFDNGKKFLKVKEDGSVIEIFDSKTFEKIDEFENDGIEIGAITITTNENFIIGAIKNGLRKWDLFSKEIIHTNFTELPDTNLLAFKWFRLESPCDGLLFGAIEKNLKEENSNHQPVSVLRYYFSVIDINSLEIINIEENRGYFKFSNNCNFLAWGVPKVDFGVEIYNFETKELLHKLPVNGPSLTALEFSPDDKYLVTSNGPGANCLKIWDIESGEYIYGYTNTSFSNIAISNDGKYLIFSVDSRLKKLHTQFDGAPVDNQIEINEILYPNPATGLITLQLNQDIRPDLQLIITDIAAQIYPLPYMINENIIEINTETLQNGTYFITIRNTNLSTYKFIINK